MNPENSLFWNGIKLLSKITWNYIALAETEPIYEKIKNDKKTLQKYLLYYTLSKEKNKYKYEQHKENLQMLFTIMWTSC